MQKIIYLQDAIDAMDFGESTEWQLIRKVVIEKLENVPPAEPKIGKWIVDRYCSECEWDKKDADYISGWKENYCPNCGAKMIKE